VGVALVGREPELSAARGWLDEAVGGSPRVVLIGGEAGIGKTTLVEAVLAEARGRGVTTVLGRVSEQAGTPPFWAWRQVLDQLGDADVLAAADGHDPQAERFARFEAAVATVGRVARRAGGLVVAIDDAHRADQGSLRFLQYLVHALVDEPVLVLVAHRSDAADHVACFAETVAELTRTPTRRTLTLAGLDRSAVAAVLGDAGQAPTVERVLALTGGNALLVGELARHLGAGGTLATTPTTIRDIVAGRLAARSAACGEVVRVAAVAGGDFAIGVLATVLDRPALAVLEQIDEAEAAGLVRAGEEPGHYRFVHELVSDAVERSIPRREAAVLHRRLAEAIEAYEGTGDDQLPALARHWEHAVVLGDADVAAMWHERAADAADRALAWEEAARLYERAVTLAGAEADPLDRHRRMLGWARALLHIDEISKAIARCVEASDAAQEAGRLDLAAEAALVVEGRGGSAGPEIVQVIDLANRILADLDASDHTRRARLLGLQAALSFYVDPERCEALSAAAVNEAQSTDDPRATIAAVRARQMVRLAPEHAEERLELANRIGTAGRDLGDPSVELWESLWRIDALVELGAVPDAVACLPTLRRQVALAPHPMARWHLARTEATLASATGRWDEAEQFGQTARDTFSVLEGAESAIAQQLGLRTAIGLNRGFATDVLDDYEHLDLSAAPSYVGDMPFLAPILPLAALGRTDEAITWYERLPPLDRWHPPPFLALVVPALRCLAAVRIGRLGDVAALADQLAVHRGRHIAGGSGTPAYLGPVTLLLGEAATALGRPEQAARDLRTAIDEARSAAIPPFEIRAAVLLAEALVARDYEADPAEAHELAEQYRPRAVAYAMRPWIARLDQLAPAQPEPAEPLSPRELEVAALVADGMTNRAIAAALYISERTAQNHVQHILTKLRLTNRTQIATWYRTR
jgi:DNA-binding CsgD family transcriptional regulator/nucleoside-triphosphatase THEP1